MNRCFVELTKRTNVIDQSLKEQDLGHETPLETFKTEICEDLEKQLEQFRQEIKSGSKETQIAVGGEIRDTPSEIRLYFRQHPRQLQQQLNEQPQSPPPLYVPQPEFRPPQQGSRCRNHVVSYPRLDHRFSTALVRE